MITKRQLFGTLLLFVGMLGLFTACGESGDDNEKKEAGSANLRVTPGSLKFGASGGKQSLSVSTIYDYLGAETSADWLDADFNDALSTLYVTASANPTDAVRNATLTIMGSNDGETIAERVTIKVEQEAGEGDTGTVFTVGPNGGKVELGDLTIDFPAGTFNGTTKVTVSEVKKESIEVNNALTATFKVKLSGGIRQKFRAAIKFDELANDEAILMMFASQAWAPSLNIEGLARVFEPVKYANGAYYTEIPAMESPDAANDAEIYFSLVYNNDLSNARTRTDYLIPRFHFDHSLSKPIPDIYLKVYDEIIPDAIEKIEALGFKKDENPINYILESLMFSLLKPDAWGCYNKSMFFGALGHSVSLNKNKFDRLSSSKDEEAKKTLIHETLHYYQTYYGGSYYFQNTATILEEATAVWAERFYGDRLNTEQCLGNLFYFIASLNPEHKDITNAPGADWGERYQNVGYGAAALIEYLSQKFGDKIVLKFFEKRKVSKDPRNTIAIIEEVVKEESKKEDSKNECDIFSQKEYQKFIEQLGCKKLYNDKFRYACFDNMISDYRIEHDTIGKVAKTISDEKPVYFTNYAYDYGALIEKLTVAGNFNGDTQKGLENTTGTIEQTKSGLKTWVYKSLGNGEFKLIGMTEEGAPLDISGSFEKTNGSYADHNYYMVTIPNELKTKEDILSRIVTKVDKINKVFDKFKTLSLDVSGTCNYKGNWSEGSYVEKEKRVSYQMSLRDQKPNVEISHNANFVKISLNLKIDNSVENTDYNVILNIDATKNIITSLEAKKTSSSSFFESSENAIIRVENIPLMKVDGNKYISHNGYGNNCVGKEDGVKMLEFHWFTGAGEVNDDWKWDGADDYQIFIEILLND